MLSCSIPFCWPALGLQLNMEHRYCQSHSKTSGCSSDQQSETHKPRPNSQLTVTLERWADAWRSQPQNSFLIDLSSGYRGKIIAYRNIKQGWEYSSVV
jgi:hypothetical protein